MASEIAKRKEQNKGVKAGTVRIGAGGKTVRRYNAKTGRWDVTKKDVKATGTTLRPTTSSNASPKKTTRVSPSARGEGVSNKGPRRPGESVGAYNDRIRNAPLSNFIANLGSSGKSRTDEKAAARNQAAYMSGKPPVQPKPKTAAQKAAEAAKEKANLEKAKAAARAQAKRASGK